MASYPAALARLIDEYRKLPGVGPKSAERLAFHTLARPRAEVAAFAGALSACAESVRPCPACGCLADGGRCPICADPRRDRHRICVLENPRNVYVFERGGLWSGLYHVLAGLISPLDGVGPEEIGIPRLLARVRDGGVTEVLLALSPSTEGESTSVYLARALEETGVAATRIAYGVPVGADLEFTDPVTLARAVEGRKRV